MTNEHVAYIIKDLNYRGIVLEGLQDEVIDHVCSAVETEMASGKNFIEAYHEVLKSFGSTAELRKMQHQTFLFDNQKTNIMVRNYFKIALRNLTKHKFYSLINIAGLAIGIASCLVIVLFVINELSFDRYNEKADRIYRVNGEIKFAGNHYRLAVAPAPFAEAVLNDYPEVESAVRFRSQGSYLVKRSESADNFKEENVIWADSTFFSIFSVPVLQGNPGRALREPNSVAISKKMADKYFPNGDALGQPLILDNRENLKVTAVYADIPQTSHFNFDIIISMSGNQEAKSNQFLSNNFNTYLLLKKGTDAKEFESKLDGLVVKYIGPEAAGLLGGEFSLEKFRASGNILQYTLMPLTSIHLHSDLTAELAPNSDITYVYLFSAIALFVLAIACINFMNLSTARSSNRAREVGVRKVMGSLRSHLVRQFLLESILLSVFSFFIALFLAYAILPVFNELASKSLTLPWTSMSFYAILMGSSVFIGFLAGLYPSFFLSGFKPINVLKGNVALGMKSGFIRSALVVFQFVISIFLIVGTITVNRQLDFIQNKKIGFKKDQVLIIFDAYALQDKTRVFKDEVLKNNRVKSGTISGYLPVNSSRSDNTFWPEGSQPTQNNMVGLQNWNVDDDYVKTLGMVIGQGRDFSPDFPSDSAAVILNETAVKQFNFGADPIGKKVSTFDGAPTDATLNPEKIRSWTVIGVVKDFHFESLKQNITPLGLFLRRSRGMVSFRFEAKNTQDIIQSVEKTWKSLAPGQPFQYSFLDEAFGRMYSSEQKLGKVFALFAGLAIAIACLGLFALTAFTAEQRTKEIGIRKVLGASVVGIVVLLSREFGKLIIIAFAIATPIAWFSVDWWLKSYTYKVEVGVLVYVAAGLLAFLVAWLTMSYQSFRAATSNPVDSLRAE